MKQRSIPRVRGERGQVIVLISLAMFVIVGVSALAIDGSFIYEKRNRLHAAADAAAKSAAIEVKRGNTASPRLRAFAKLEVEAHGFNDSVIQAVNFPYTSPACSAGSLCVEVILRENTSTFFASVLGFANLSPSARSVAGSASSIGCLVTLNSTGPGLTLNGANVTANACDVMVNSEDSAAIDISGRIDARSTGVVGQIHGSPANIHPAAITGIPHFSDPLAGIYTAPTGTSCTSGTPLVVGNNDRVTVLSNGPPSSGLITTVCGITMNNGSTIDFDPGIYVIDGGIDLKNNNTINGANVTLYVKNGVIDIKNGLTMNIVAPTSGDYAGMAVWQDGNSISLKNGGHWNVVGITYVPDATGFHVDNGSDIGGDCTIFVVGKLDVAHNSTFDNTCVALGGNPLLTISLAE